jgi:phosphate transport system substrate-binding protein
MQRAVERYKQHKTNIILIVLETVNPIDPFFTLLPIVLKNRISIFKQDEESALQEIVSAVRLSQQWITSSSNFLYSPDLRQTFVSQKTSSITPDTSSKFQAVNATIAAQSQSSSPQIANTTPSFSKLGNFLLSRQLLSIILTIALSTLAGILIGLWINPFVQRLPVLSDPQWSNLLQILGIMIPILITVLGFNAIKSKRLSYETISDVGLLNEQKDKGEDDIRLIVNGWEENHAGIKIVKLENTGDEPVKKADYEDVPILFQFEPQSLIRCSIHDIVPENKFSVERLKESIKLDEQNHAFVEVQALPLNPKESINLKIVTRDKTEMKVVGGLVGGKITHMKIAQMRAIQRTILMSLIISLLLGLAIPNLFSIVSGFPLSNCVWGTISIDSSTAFNNTMGSLVNKYQKICPLAHLSLNSKPSANSIGELEQNVVQLATSEITPQEAGPPYDGYKDLQENKLAAIAFNLVINKNVTGVHSLSRDQISKIYDGTYTKWGDVGGQPANLKIIPIGRSNDSGTYYAFVSFILSSRNQNKPSLTLSGTPEVLDRVTAISGAIGYVDVASANSRAKDVATVDVEHQAPAVAQVTSNRYPFWTIERLYTKPNPDPLTRAFVTYIIDNFRTNSAFTSLDTIPKDVLTTHQ